MHMLSPDALAEALHTCRLEPEFSTFRLSSDSRRSGNSSRSEQFWPVVWRPNQALCIPTARAIDWLELTAAQAPHLHLIFEDHASASDGSSSS